jgi:hypothetical protein
MSGMNLEVVTKEKSLSLSKSTLSKRTMQNGNITMKKLKYQKIFTADPLPK